MENSSPAAFPALSPELMGLLRCPVDGAPLVHASTGSALSCTRAAHSAQWRGGILDFSPAPGTHAFEGWVAWTYDLLLSRVLLRRFAVRRQVLERLHERAVKAARGGLLLDGPCGTAVLSAPWLLEAGLRAYVGVDLALPMLQRAQRRLRMCPTLLVRGDLCALPLAEGTADVALCSLGLQFIRDRAMALRALRRALRPGGLCLGAAPALGLFDGYDRRHATRPDPDFPLTASTFASELVEAGFRDVTLSTEGALILWEATASS
ncbi:class I SAM-dependent methyltransferase [Hyalangium sp.]|uniref:class I SAM-dependent methyltransferase n=1 Tax=Hyalangium sp. TaxID=2028555 RepID=UPI002D2DA9A4|nr:methyltransferase domain-containing protein [Hyalangium sp.]HYH97665.1 methyltransferase domain-containing protein [Hyalangium sp.]